jgi:ABC-type transporter Mla subunit MlaD
MPISIDLLANATSFLRGAKDVEGALDDVADSLDDVARDAQRSGDKLGREYEGASRDVEDAGERLERTFKELRDTVQRETKSGGDSMKRNFKESTSAASRDLEELGNEAKANASETFSSFDGSAQSLVEGIQGTFGGIVSSLGPIGAAAGAAGAIGIGLMLAEFDKGTERNEEFRASVAELATEFIETGEIGAASIDFIVDRLRELATQTEDGKVNLADLNDAARDAGRGLDVLADAYGANRSEIEKIIDRERDLLEQYKLTEQGAMDSSREAFEAAQQRAQGQQKIVDELQRTRDMIVEAADAEAAYVAAGGPELERKAALVESLNDAYDDVAGSVEEYINEESGLFDVGAYITAMQEREQALRDYQTTLATSALSPEARDFLNDQGVEAAAQFLAGYQKATPEQQRELNRIWTESGRQNSGAYTGALTAGIPATIPGPRLTLEDPDIESIIGNLQRRAAAISIRFPAAVFTDKGVQVF